MKSAYALYSVDSSIRALNDTLVAAAGAQTGITSNASSSGGSDVQILNSIVYGFPYSFETSAASGGVAEINARFDNYDGLSSGSDIFRTPDIGSDPGFVDALGGDYHLAFNSPLIDASSTTNLGSDSPSSDLDSNPRVVVDGNAATPVDLGAYEYQHRAPEAQAKASPSSGNPGTVFSFDSTGSHDADDGDHLSYSWSFDDGASASGATASHAFSTPGQHNASLTVTDSSGLTSTATATVTVTAPVTGVTPGSAASGSPTKVVGSTGNDPGTNPGGGTQGGPAPARGNMTIRISRLRIHGTSITVRLSCGRAARCSAVNLVVMTTVHHHSVKIGALRLNLRPRSD